MCASESRNPRAGQGRAPRKGIGLAEDLPTRCPCPGPSPSHLVPSGRQHLPAHSSRTEPWEVYSPDNFCSALIPAVEHDKPCFPENT